MSIKVINKIQNNSIQIPKSIKCEIGLEDDDSVIWSKITKTKYNIDFVKKQEYLKISDKIDDIKGFCDVKNSELLFELLLNHSEVYDLIMDIFITFLRYFKYSEASLEVEYIEDYYDLSLNVLSLSDFDFDDVNMKSEINRIKRQLGNIGILIEIRFRNSTIWY